MDGHRPINNNNALFVEVCGETGINSSARVRVPVEPDGSIRLFELARCFPGAVSLKFQEQGCWNFCRVIENRIQPPDGIWNSYNRRYFVCVASPCRNSVPPLGGLTLEELTRERLCSSYLQYGFCQKQQCAFVHGDLCDICSKYALHPFSEQERETHLNECIERHYRSLEAQEEEVLCVICLEDMVELSRTNMTKRFAHLQNCQHVFCFDCLRTWRRQGGDKCPLCGVVSQKIIATRSVQMLETELKQRLILEGGS